MKNFFFDKTNITDIYLKELISQYFQKKIYLKISINLIDFKDESKIISFFLINCNYFY